MKKRILLGLLLGLFIATTAEGVANYYNLAGKTLVGSIASGGNLTLGSTTHATKGKQLFGAAGTSFHSDVTDAFTMGGGCIGCEGPRVFSVCPTGCPYATIGAGITAGAALTPTSTNPALVVVGPGTYVENVTLSPWVYVSAVDPVARFVPPDFSVLVTGNLTFSSTSAATEASLVAGVRFSGNLSTDSSGKSAGTMTLVLNGVIIAGTTTCLGRNTSDFLYSVNTTFVNTISMDTIAARYLGCVAFSTTTYHNSATTAAPFGTVGGCLFAGVTLLDTSTFTMASGEVGALTVAAGASADIRGVAKFGTLTGPGPINRTVINGSTGALLAGAGQDITFTVPLVDANYKVQLTPTATATLPILVTAIAATKFTVTAPTGGGTWDYTVVHN